ncbi:ABC transporter permease [Bryobacterales bacterium F-183]|nr:ABC transporter permease [Bryobacterales bacterium F-183]
MRFETFVANRYLRAKRRQKAISLVTVISILGVAAGVMALVVALAINNGFRRTLQDTLLSATAHVSILEKQPGYGIKEWPNLLPKLQAIPGVKSAAPGLYGPIFLSGPQQSQGAILKGILPGPDSGLSDSMLKLKEGSIQGLNKTDGLPGIVLGSRLAQSTGMLLNSIVTVISPQGELTPFGPRPSFTKLRVVGIFETGFSDIDSQWALASLGTAQQLLSLEDVVNTIEIKLDDPERAAEVAKAATPIVGDDLVPTTWMEQNRQLRNALKLERLVTVITIGLIQLVAGLNIFITLTMMVMEKTRDIAVLMSMGARREQIRRIFLMEGVLIGSIGAVLGLALGYAICFICGHYKLIRLDEDVYALNFVPFEPLWYDGIWIAAAALAVSVAATLYPATAATKIAPAETLRYE